MTAHPVAYLRRSYVDPDSPGDISREAQRAAVRQLAVADGHNGDLVEYDGDWGVSADPAKRGQLSDYARLLADMEAGRVSAVYAFDVDRLYRDPRDLIRLQDAAQAHRVTITTTSGRLAIGDGDDPAAEAFAFIGSVFGRLELQKARKRARAGQEARRARGDRFGHPVYGFSHARDAATGRIVRVVNPAQPIEPVLAAVRNAGSILGACRLLNARRIPSAKGDRWYTSQLTRVLKAHSPELLPRQGPTGRRTPTHAALAQLLCCHCGTTLTPNATRGQLYCSRGHLLGAAAHGKYNLREADILPWLQAEAARLRIPRQRVSIGDPQTERVELEARRERVGLAMIRGMVSLDAASAEQAGIDAALARLNDAARVEIIPQAIDWSLPPADLNEVLRALWERVDLGPDMLPTAAVWRVPEWRHGA